MTGEKPGCLLVITSYQTQMAVGLVHYESETLAFLAEICLRKACKSLKRCYVDLGLHCNNVSVQDERTFEATALENQNEFKVWPVDADIVTYTYILQM